MDTTLPERRPLALTWGFLAQAGQPLHGWQTPYGYRFDAATWLVPEALTRRADFALALARRTPTLDFFRPYLDAATLDTIATAVDAPASPTTLHSPNRRQAMQAEQQGQPAPQQPPPPQRPPQQFLHDVVIERREMS